MQKYEKIAGLLLLAVGVGVAVHSYAVLDLGMLITPDAGFMPFLLGLALIGLSSVWLFQLYRMPAGSGTAAGFIEKKRGIKLITAVGFIFAYAWLFERIGYLSSTLVFMGLWQVVLEREKIWKTLIIAGISTFCLYLLFSKLLKVPLPYEFFLR